MKSFGVFFLVVVSLTTLVSGCGPGAPKVTSADMKTFETAPRELQETWARANAAGQTNDYVLAILTLRSLLTQKLSVDQVEAVQNAIRAYNVKLMAAADRGDAAAQKGLETLRAGAAPALRQ